MKKNFLEKFPEPIKKIEDTFNKPAEEMLKENIAELKKAGWKKVFNENGRFLGWIENTPPINGFQIIFSKENALIKLEAAKLKTASS